MKTASATTGLAFRAVDIYCFSGTGNTLLVARAMHDEFELQGVETSLRRLETADPKTVRLDRALGLAFAVAAQGTYPLVWRFVKALPRCEGVPVFMTDTMMGFSGGVVGPMRRIVEREPGHDVMFYRRYWLSASPAGRAGVSLSI